MSFYYCYDHTGGRVETIVAEITNTPWGERHAYVLPVDPADAESHRLHFNFEKIFHVSPYMPMDMAYEWTFTAPGENLSVHMVNRRQNQLAFDATLRLTRKPLNAYHCTRMLAVYPLVTVKVIAAIYWQAFRLRLKRIPFYPHPHRRKSDQEAGGVEVKSS